MRRLKWLASILLVAAPLFADGTRVLTTATPATVPVGSIVCGGTDSNNYSKFISATTSKAYDVSVADVIVVHVYSDAGSTATVDIETAPTASGPWFPVTADHITDPSAVGEAWSVPRQNYVRINVTAWTSGNVRACISAYRADKKIF